MIRAHIIIPAIDLITILAPLSASGDYEVTFTDYAEPASGWNIDDIEIWGVPPGRTPVPTPTPEFSPTPESSPTPCRPSWSDFNGDGTADIAIFRPSSGLWAVRGVTRIYFDSRDDEPIPADYTGNGISDVGIFRETSGL
jgi:hypothetical protein